MNNLKECNRKHKKVEVFLEKFEGHIVKNLKQTAYEEQEDLAQELRLKITEKVLTLELKESLNFWDVFFKREVS